ncbi:MAG: saccharopine dehydrogenase NADP-binding domain-containing protein [Thermoplasmata archaeon]|nr:saccharopine dehydrogenase NADP-binding domain-containing protein [Thermoplasmata archaeon]
MKKVVVFGAGLVAAPLVEYLLNQTDLQVTVATRTVSKAEKMVGNAPNGKAMAFTIDQEEKLDQLISENDLAISLLPYTHHVKIAKKCIEKGRSMVTTSYVSAEMKALDEEAKKAGVLLLNESGLDPGIDHMSAMRIIHDVQKKGGRIANFTSFCGGLPAPEANSNPFGYKFSWSPKGVLLAGTNNAQYKMDGKEITVPAKDLFISTKMMHVEGMGDFEGYPNRDSVPYKDIYGISDTDTILRGTFRYPGWCPTLKAFSDLGLLSKDPAPSLAGKAYKDLMLHIAGGGDDAKTAVASKLGMAPDALPLNNMGWLGLFSDTPLPEGVDAPIDMICHIMEEKMGYAKDERDMIVLQHNFIAEYPEKKEHIVSTLIAYGIPGGYSAMARTVGLPAAIAAKMILRGEIKETGVHIPIEPGIYNPILDELEKESIGFDESTGAA